VYRITAVSSAARSATVSIGAARPVRASKLAGRGDDHLGPGDAWPPSAPLGEQREDHRDLGAGIAQVKEISPALSSGFIGTTIAPRRRIA
jgi:hypothetical protein